MYEPPAEQPQARRWPPLALLLAVVVCCSFCVLYIIWLRAVLSRSPSDDFVHFGVTECIVVNSTFMASTISCAGGTNCRSTPEGKKCSGRSGCSCLDQWAYRVEAQTSQGTLSLRGILSRDRDRQAEIGQYCPAHGDCGCAESAGTIDSEHPMGPSNCWLAAKGVSLEGPWPFSYTCSLCDEGCSSASCVKFEDPAVEWTRRLLPALLGSLATAVSCAAVVWEVYRFRRRPMNTNTSRKLKTKASCIQLAHLAASFMFKVAAPILMLCIFLIWGLF